MNQMTQITSNDLEALIKSNPNGIVLLEGRRNIPNEFAAKAESLARSLALKYPNLRFRSGNANGTDEAFSKGVASVDPSRLHVVAPYASHRKKFRYAGAVYDSPETLTQVEEDTVAYKTSAASPKAKGLVSSLGKKGAAGAKAAYLIRDTMKVTGYSADFQKPICALFYVDPSDPLAGGTGHTIRVCQQEGVPFAFQESWAEWLRS